MAAILQLGNHFENVPGKLSELADTVSTQRWLNIVQIKQYRVISGKLALQKSTPQVFVSTSLKRDGHCACHGPPGPLNPFQGTTLAKPHQGAHEGVLVMGTLLNRDPMDGGTQKMCCLSSLFNEAPGTPPGAKAPPKEEMG